MYPSENKNEQHPSSNPVSKDLVAEQDSAHESIKEAKPQSPILENEDSRNSHIALILLCVATLCALLVVILSFHLISGFLHSAYKGLDNPSRQTTIDDIEIDLSDLDIDVDFGDIDYNTSIDRILSDFNTDEFNKTVSRDIAEMMSESKSVSDNNDEIKNHP